MLDRNAEKQEQPYLFAYLLDEWADLVHEKACADAVARVVGVSQVRTDQTALRGMAGCICSAFGIRGKVTVAQWLHRIAGARFVVTNSFHGTVFAILFQRPFIVTLLSGRMADMNERVLSLLQLLGLEDRAIFPDRIERACRLSQQPVDWATVDRRLQDMRRSSLHYLEQALS